MLGKYIDQMFKFDGKNKNPNDSKRILLSGQCQVTQKDLCNELIEIKIETNNDEIDIGYNQKDDEIDDQDLTRNITSLIIHNVMLIFVIYLQLIVDYIKFLKFHFFLIFR